ncbi:hypothetical protein [Chryseobacterium sp.]|uniref:hypothetical protein n=1 Tax=Chryseobacterium sp. TaxID=1871047 RepID=UPI0011C8F2BA|nr:hypothetical protein [Chryseobacterium sp.]TXF75928.1 hypothetical protein FUA25_08465 [Chryseobacterium sp.]
MVEIYIGAAPQNKRKSDVDGTMEMIRQVMDIFDISIRAVDYSKTFKMPMTANNKEIFEGLGFTDSQFPYKRSYADVYVSGILIMKDAFVQVKEFEDQYYSVSLISESKEIWKVVENNTLADLDLEDTAYPKSALLIKEQWELGLTPSAKFLYLLADYGGKIPSANTVFADYLVPSYRLSYLVDKINTKYDVNVVLPSFLDDTFITFSDANEIEETNDKIVFEQNYSIPKKVSEITYTIEEDGTYVIEVNGVFGSFGTVSGITISIGNYSYFQPGSGFSTINHTSPEIYLRSHDILKIIGSNDQDALIATLKITRKAIDVSGNKSFQNYKITDFLKEIIYQSASIPIKTGNTYDFITLTEIIENEATDWSRFFDRSGRTTLIIGKYGQNNWLRYKYAEPEDFNKDGLIPVQNVNLDTNKDIIKSTLYNTPVNSIGFILGGTDLLSQQYHLWKRTVEQKDGVFVERYQAQSGRMFLITGTQETTASNFDIMGGSNTVSTNKAILANNEAYNFQTVVNNRYKEFSKILRNAKIIEAVFKIPLIEFANFDFKRRIYVSQLEGYFIINRIVFKSGELMTAELIEANISPETITPPGPIEMSIVFQSNLSKRKIIGTNQGDLITENILIINTDPTGQTFELFIDDVSWPFIITGSQITFEYEANVDLLYGQHLIKVSNGTETTDEIQYRIIENITPVGPGPFDPYDQNNDFQP